MEKVEIERKIQELQRETVILRASESVEEESK